MTAEAKASELREKFTQMIFDSGNTVSKPMVNQCAIICVEEICRETIRLDYETRSFWHEVLYYLKQKQ